MPLVDQRLCGPLSAVRTVSAPPKIPIPKPSRSSSGGKKYFPFLSKNANTLSAPLATLLYKQQEGQAGHRQ